MNLSVPLETAVSDLQSFIESDQCSWFVTDIIFSLGVCLLIVIFGLTTIMIVTVSAYLGLRYAGYRRLSYNKKLLAFYEDAPLPELRLSDGGIIIPLLAFPACSRIGRSLMRTRQLSLYIQWDEIRQWELLSVNIPRAYGHYHGIRLEKSTPCPLRAYLLTTSIPVPGNNHVVIKTELFRDQDYDVISFAKYFLGDRLDDGHSNSFTRSRLFAKISAPY